MAPAAARALLPGAAMRRFTALLVCAAFAGACSFRDDDVAPKVAQTASAVTTSPAATQLLVLDGGRLFGVAAQGGAAGALTADDWTGARAIASVNGVAYAVEGATLYRIDPISGARTALGSPAWAGTSLL